MTGRRVHRRVLAWGARVLVLGLLVLAVPSPAPAPATLSLVTVGTARTVDFAEGVVWVLALGSDARPGQVVTEGRADAIQLIGLDIGSGRAVAVGVPRDAWVDLPGDEWGFDKINAGLAVEGGGPELMAAAVEELLGIAPDYVVTTGLEGFETLVGTVGTLDVYSPRAFSDEEYDIVVRRGLNRMDARESLGFARSRLPLTAGDFARSANQQQLLRAILRKLRGEEDTPGFMEEGSLAALANLDTNLAPTELYRLAQAVTEIDPRRVTTCVLTGTDDTIDGAAVIRVDPGRALAVGADARDDLRVDAGCTGA